MLKKLLIATIMAISLSNAYADTDTDAKSSGLSRSKPGLIDKYFKLSTLLGAGVSQCPTLTEIITDGWQEARYFMVIDMMSMGIQQEEAISLVDRTYNGAASMPIDSNIIKSCDMVLDVLYQFEKEIKTIKTVINAEAPPTTTEVSSNITNNGTTN